MTPKDLEVTCPHCGKKFRAPLSYAGKADCCSGCGRSIRIPEAAPPKIASATQIMSTVVATAQGRFKSCIVRNPETPHLICMATGERLRVPIVAPVLAPLLGLLPAEVGPLLNHADRIVIECSGARVPVVMQFFSDNRYSAFAVPSAVVPAPAAVRSVVPCQWGPDGLGVCMAGRSELEIVPWKAVKAIAVAAIVREVTTVFGPAHLDHDSSSRVGLALGNVSGTVGTNLMMGPSGTQTESVMDPAMVHLLVESEKLPAGQVECLELDERHLKYEFLGPDKAPGSVQNFTLLVRGLLERLPDAFVTDSARAVAAGERHIRVIQNRRSMIMFWRWMLACDFARRACQKDQEAKP